MKYCTVLMVMIAAMLLFAGCGQTVEIEDDTAEPENDPIPKEYIDGVLVDESFPDEIEIDADAIVFAFEGSKKEYELFYGTQNGMDDVVDLYDSTFESNGKIAVSKNENNDITVFEGISDNCKFAVTVQPARDDTEKSVFTTVVEIKTVEISPKERMKGFWVYSGYRGELDITYKLKGAALDIGNSTIDYYSEYELTDKAKKYTFTGENSIERHLDDKVYPAEVEFDVVDGKEIMTIWGVTDPTYVRSSCDEMMEKRYEPPFKVYGEYVDYLIMDITSTSITVAWEGNVHADQFIFRVTGDDIDFERGSITNHPGVFTFEELTPGAQYTVCVTQDNGRMSLPGEEHTITLPTE